MDSSIIPFLEIEVQSITLHEWERGEQMLRFPAFHYNIWLLLEGHVTVVADDTQWLIEAGQMFMMPIRQVRDITTPEGARWLSVGMRMTLFNRTDLLSALKLPHQWHPSQEERADVEMWLRQLLRELQQTETSNHLLRTGLGSAVLGRCWHYLNQEAASPDAVLGLPHWLSSAINQIQEHPGVSIHELAHDVGVSPAHFRRAFHKWMGVAPRDYLRSQRMAAARRILETTDEPLRNIALKVGFTNTTHFSAVFTQTYGTAPNQYRLDSYQKQL
jgi:AraC-like DNA-binding protein